MRVITPTSRCALSAERNTWECVEWGRMLATCVARRGITLGTAPRTPRIRTLHIQAGMRTVSYMRFKPGLKGSSIAQGRLEAPELRARMYAHTRGDAEAGTSHVVTG